MNTRIQVEHPITEMITGVDLISQQIQIASGKPLTIQQHKLQIKGHAIECRINAEIPERGFMPCSGTVKELFLPGGRGVRIDSALYEGYKVPPQYDSMLAKIITYGETRQEAIQTMKRALSEVNIEGIQTNIAFEYQLINTSEFIEGKCDTGFIENHLEHILGGDVSGI